MEVLKATTTGIYSSENDNVYVYKRHLKEIKTVKSNLIQDICLDLTFYWNT